MNYFHLPHFSVNHYKPHRSSVLRTGLWEHGLDLLVLYPQTKAELGALLENRNSSQTIPSITQEIRRPPDPIPDQPKVPLQFPGWPHARATSPRGLVLPACQTSAGLSLDLCLSSIKVAQWTTWGLILRFNSSRSLLRTKKKSVWTQFPRKQQRTNYGVLILDMGAGRREQECFYFSPDTEYPAFHLSVPCWQLIFTIEKTSDLESDSSQTIHSRAFLNDPVNYSSGEERGRAGSVYTAATTRGK